MRRVLIPLLMTVLMVGCADKDSAKGDDPTAVPTVDEFCTAYFNFMFDTAHVGEDQDVDDYLDAVVGREVRELAQEFETVGVPAELPSGPRRALEAFVDRLVALPDDATYGDAFSSRNGETAGSTQNVDDVDALLDWVSSECPTPEPSPG